MDRAITRRDFLNGIAMAVGVAAVGWPRGPARAAQAYPPAAMGLRGHYPGAFEVMHAVRDGTFWQTAGSPRDMIGLK
jgi:spermidine dehydrogenase